eukprot:CAMPEP_0172838790 /NCGR_PEP_ID=MMETSP1075-20121228/28122_1 /TAXON_ID=2916 /ORGANISM="Ceratium fusus, Strain PA161109" /LENGTH=74 /DNA_ID=CAMNT_0013682353 /DNA_START=54 /DNA_END=276 /DNA_ORIENTATION=-
MIAGGIMRCGPVPREQSAPAAGFTSMAAVTVTAFAAAPLVAEVGNHVMQKECTVLLGDAFMHAALALHRWRLSQ